MKIIYIYDLEDENKKLKVDRIIFEVNNSNEINTNTEIKNTISDKIKKNNNYDIYVLLIDDTAKIKEICSGIKNKEGIIILTENLASSHILECIEITPNICYTKNEAKQIAKRIFSVYMKENV